MKKLTRTDLFSLEKYSEMRAEFREQVMQHKQSRRLPIGPNATLYFEDRTTIQYQVQEMLRIEKIFDADGIEEELLAYNPLIPDGHNWKATFMIEFDDPEERKQRLAGLVGIEDCIWMRVGDNKLIIPVCDEDLERATEDKTSAVHFTRFELTQTDVAALGDGAAIAAGICHQGYNYTVEPIPAPIQAALLQDID
ncbi:MAG: DUF3501 family protein [Gammaproteobacteria bacterium]